jgi:hypothetical protein
MSWLPASDSAELRTSRVTRRRLAITVAALILVAAVSLAITAGVVSAAKDDSGGNTTAQAASVTVASCEAAIELDPHDVASYLALADLHGNGRPRDLAAAATVLEQCIAANPAAAAAYRELGTVELLLGHNATAVRVLNEYRRLAAPQR